MKVAWSPLAAEQVEAALAYIAADSPVAAREWLERLLERVESLGRFTDAGRIVPEFQREDLREIIMGAYRVMYRRRDGLVEIAAVRHHARDVDQNEITSANG